MQLGPSDFAKQKDKISDFISKFSWEFVFGIFVLFLGQTHLVSLRNLQNRKVPDVKVAALKQIVNL